MSGALSWTLTPSMKDSGGAIPGIGGLFDLTDSLILAALTGYFILIFIQK